MTALIAQNPAGVRLVLSDVPGVVGIRFRTKAAAPVIYYAAIASALVFHSHKITQHSYEKLHQAYAELEQKPWIPTELMGLFRRALALCQQQKAKKN